MGYPTDSTSWPSSSLPDSVKKLIDNFFSLVDLKDPEAGSRLADEIFTTDGKFSAVIGSFEGTARMSLQSCLTFKFQTNCPLHWKDSRLKLCTEIRESRKKAWDTVSSRRHEVLKVYVNNSKGLDLILVGKVATTSAGVEAHSHEFVAQAEVVGMETPRLKFYTVLVSGKEVGWYSL